MESQPHRRFNLLTGEWVLVSPHRSQRPWQGQVEKIPDLILPYHDPKCYLCPGNERAGGHSNPDYTGTFSFINDFSALLDMGSPHEKDEGLFRMEVVRGICKVLCFSPRHDLTLSRLPIAQVREVVDLWCREFKELGDRPDIKYVQIFENRGAMMGASNPHPHGQVWAGSWIPDIPSREGQNQEKWFHDTGTCLLCRYAEEEIEKKERVIFQNQHWIALVPYWAVWPFEALVLPYRHVPHLGELTQEEKHSLAEVLKRLGSRYDNLFQTSFPYSMGIHQAPTDGGLHKAWHMHIHYLPPLLRSATVKKFMVGFELLAMPQRDITPETAAAHLREQSDHHYMGDPI